MKNIYLDNNKVIEGAEFFDNYNWFNFEHGDIVWMEDFDGVENAAYFKNSSDDSVNLVSLSDAEFRLAAKYDLESVYPLFG